MFESTGVMTHKELEARNEVKWETYTKKIQIEARVLGDLAMNHKMCIRDRAYSRHCPLPTKDFRSAHGDPQALSPLIRKNWT